MITKILPFNYKTQPYTHQNRGFERSKEMKAFALFWEMGTGKSKPIIDTAAYLFLNKEIDGLVLVSDKGAYLNWETDEVPKHMPDNVQYRIAHWSSAASTAEKKAVESLLVVVDDKLDILCVNIEALSSPRAQNFVAQFLKNHYAMMVIDEATSIKNPKADRTKAAINLGQLCEYRRIATGTPITQSPLDLFSMFQFLQPGCLGFTSFTAFRSYYATMVQFDTGRVKFMKVTGFRNLEVLKRSIEPFSSRILKSECLDLPDKVYETLYVEQTPEQQQAYKSLKSTAIVQLQQGLVTSTLALTTIGKLHQINCGHIKLDGGEIVELPNNRIPMLLDLLKKLGKEKVLIWCAFQKDVELIMKALEDPDMDAGYAVHYYGPTTTEERAEHLRLFHEDPNCLWFVGTQATGGKGLTLVEASYSIYYSNTYSLEDRLQSEDRNHRIGQHRKVTYFDFVCKGTVDVKILDSHKRKEDLAHQVLDNFEELL